MKTMIATLLLIGSMAQAECPRGAACDVPEIKKRELLKTICSTYQGRQRLLADIAYERKGGNPGALVPGPNEFKIKQDEGILKTGEPRFIELINDYPKWYGHPFDPKECSSPGARI